VISVGNISSGGTGKTPFVLALIRYFLSRGQEVAVVLRGYAQKSGLSDEAELYRQALSEHLVFETPDRRVGLSLAKEAGAAVVLLDDAFQHRRVHRDLNLVLLDLTRPPWQDHILPWGFLREGMSALKRSDGVILTRCEQVSNECVQVAVERVQKQDQSVPIFEARTEFRTVENGLGDHVLGCQRVYLVSAIGHPENFKASASAAGHMILGEQWFPDHHHFTKAEMLECLDAAEKMSARVMMTSKDAVKWALHKDRILILQIGLHFDWEAFAGAYSEIVE
jgi:tetraacyldisaccharide 4'-kinase